MAAWKDSLMPLLAFSINLGVGHFFLNKDIQTCFWIVSLFPNNNMCWRFCSAWLMVGQGLQNCILISVRLKSSDLTSKCKGKRSDSITDMSLPVYSLIIILTLKPWSVQGGSFVQGEGCGIETQIRFVKKITSLSQIDHMDCVYIKDSESLKFFYQDQLVGKPW